MTTFATLQKPDNLTKRQLYPFWGKQPLSRLSDIHRLHLASYPSSLHQIRPQHHEIVFCLTHKSNPSYAHIPKRDFLQQDRMNEEKFVIYQGTRMIEGWPERIRKAQKQRTYNIAGKEHARIPYGDEDHDLKANKYPCHDCRVSKGQFHFVSCDVEQCPACGRQALSCDCDYDFDDEASNPSIIDRLKLS